MDLSAGVYLGYFILRNVLAKRKQ